MPPWKVNSVDIRGEDAKGKLVKNRVVIKEGCTVNVFIADKKKENIIIAEDIYIAVIDIVENIGIAVVPK